MTETEKLTPAKLADLLDDAERERIPQGYDDYFPEEGVACALGAAYCVATGNDVDGPTEDEASEWVEGVLEDDLQSYVPHLNDTRRLSFGEIASKLRQEDWRTEFAALAAARTHEIKLRGYRGF